MIDEVIAEILSTGTEICTGSITDTNSAFIARSLEAAGLKVTRHSCVADDMGMLVSILKEIGDRSDICVATGGLGPTPDDLTSAAAAEAARVRLVVDPLALAAIENLFSTRNRPMPPSNRKQAMFPEGARPIVNPVGTAPGFMMKLNRCTFFFLPGVPSEMIRMLEKEILPRIADRIAEMKGSDRSFSQVHTLSSFGVSEAEIGERLEAIDRHFPGIRFGLRADFPVIQIHLYARGRDRRMVEKQVEDAVDEVRRMLGAHLFSERGLPMEAEIGRLLLQSRATVSVAESCTGGLIAHWLTNVSGSSEYFLFSATTYSNDSKIDLVGVSRKTIERSGAVHEETAREMAEGIRRVSNSTYGLSTSGIAGPTGGTAEKPVGTVCIGIAGPNASRGIRFRFPYTDRLKNKKIFAMTALDLLRKELVG